MFGYQLAVAESVHSFHSSSLHQTQMSIAEAMNASGARTLWQFQLDAETRGAEEAAAFHAVANSQGFGAMNAAEEGLFGFPTFSGTRRGMFVVMFYQRAHTSKLKWADACTLSPHAQAQSTATHSVSIGGTHSVAAQTAANSLARLIDSIYGQMTPSGQRLYGLVQWLKQPTAHYTAR